MRRARPKDGNGNAFNFMMLEREDGNRRGKEIKENERRA
jgi:hypothetical protein